jgi:DNA-directed RNA polymerase subunit beta'
VGPAPHADSGREGAASSASRTSPIGETVRVEEAAPGQQALVVIEHKGEKHPQIIIEDKEGNILDFHYLPAKARIEVADGEEIKPGTCSPASRGRERNAGHHRWSAARDRDLRGAQAEGAGGHGGDFRPRRDSRRQASRQDDHRVRNVSDSGIEKEHHVPQDKQLLVHAGDAVEAGDPLIDGPAIPHDILRIKGEEALQNYLLERGAVVYRRRTSINDKHIEVILAQMLRKVKIENPGDSIFLPSEVVDKFAFRRENDRLAKSVKIHVVGDTDYREGEVVLKRELSEANDAVEEEGGEPAKGKRPKPAVATTLLLGITKASLSSESFISAASFQETTKVLSGDRFQALRAYAGGPQSRTAAHRRGQAGGRLRRVGRCGYRDGRGARRRPADRGPGAGACRWGGGGVRIRSAGIPADCDRG